MNLLLQDLRFAFRRLAGRPLPTLAALICGALGIGLCTTIFSVFYAMLVRPFPFADPDSIVALVSENLQRGIEQRDLAGVGYSELLRYEISSLESIAGSTEVTLTFSGSGEPERLSGAAVSANLFSLLRIEPAMGRQLTPEDDRPGAPDVVLLSHDFWQRSLGGDPAVLQSLVRIDERPFQVIGVMPPGFQYPTQQQAWIPLAPRLEGNLPGDRRVQVLARLNSESSLGEVEAELTGIAASLAERYPESHTDWRWRALKLRNLFVSPGMRIMSVTMVGAAIFVLLIACANVANLFLAQAASRGLEISLRAAIGASPFRIVCQLLTESLLVLLASGLLGAGLAVFGIRALASLFPAENPIPYWMEFSLDPAVLLFTAAISTLAGIASGLAPALNASKLNLVSLLNGSARGLSGGGRLRSALVVVEVGLSVVLLICGALFVRSFFEIKKVDTGYEEQGLTALRLHLSGRHFDASEARVQEMRDAVRRVRSLPGVESVLASSLLPLAGGGSINTLEVEGQSHGDGKKPGVFWAGISPGYFATLGVSVESGRELDDAEGWESQYVAVVNRSFVKRFLPDGEVLSRRLRIDSLDSPEEPRWFTIVGMIPDLKIRALDRPVRPAVYVPFPFLASRTSGMVVRTRGNTPFPLAAVRNEIRATHPGIPIFDVASLASLRSRASWQLQLVSRMFTVFGLLALVLAATGLYGVLAYTVSQQRREIGIRVALGAQRKAILAHVVQHGLKLAGIGLLVGVAAALVLSRLLSSFLYGISTVDPISFVGLSLFLLLIASLATFVPAWRATQVEANEVLRQY